MSPVMARGRKRGQAADLELAEGLGEGGEDPEDEDGVQDGHWQHQGNASCGCEVINGSHIGGDIQGAHGHKVGCTQSHDLPQDPGQISN